MSMASVLLASVGVITGGVTLNPIVLGTLTTTGILLKSYNDIKNMRSKTELLKFSLTSYEKVLTNLGEATRGGDFHYKEFIHDTKILEQEILDLSPLSYKFEKKYYKKFAASGEYGVFPTSGEQGIPPPKFPESFKIVYAGCVCVRKNYRYVQWQWKVE